MVASGVGQYSINVKSNLKDFYGSLTKAQRTLKELTEKKNQLQIDSSQLDKLRDKGQRIAAEMRELRQQKNEIKLGTKEVDNVDAALKNIDKKISSLNRQKLEVEAEIQPIRTANTQLYKVEQEIDRINNQKVDIKFSDSVKNIGSNIQNLGDGILKTFNPLTSKLNQMFGFGLITKGIDTVTSMVNNSVDSAIKRVDTLNNYTKVMSNLGVNEKDANSSKATLVKGLQGLPTALDDGVSAVQRFTSVNSDVNKSTKMFLALNNALLAGGAGAEIQSSALEQLSQSYSKGKPDITEFRSMQTAMPGQLKQVAKAMGMTTAELQQAMTGKDATVSMEQFLNKVVELNEKGSDGFKSFAEQAKNATGGVQTGIANMRTAVTRGVANIITSLDTMLQKANLGGISGVMSKIGSTIEKGLTSVGTAIENNKGTIINFISSLEKNFSKAFAVIQKFDFGAFFDGLGKGLNGLKNDGKSIINFIKPLFEILGKVAGDKNTPETLGKLIPRLFELGIALKAIGTATKVSGSVGGFLGKLTGLKLPKLPSFGGKAQEGELPLKNIGINDLKSLGMKMLTLAGLSANIFLAAKAIEEVNKIGNLRNLQPKLLAIAEAIVGTGVISAALGKVNELLGGSVVSGLLLIVGIAADIFLVAKALEEVANIDGDFGSLQSKIGQIALAITEIGTLAGVVGLITNTGIGAAALVSGLVAIIGITGTLYLVAVALKKVSKINLDSDIIESNINSISRVIKSMSKMTFKENLITQLDKILSQLLNLALIGELIGIGKELEKIQELNLDYSSINNNLDGISKGITAVTSIKYNESLVTSFIKGGIAGNLKKVIDEIIEITNKFENLQGRSIISDSLTSQIKAIREGISAITAIKFNESIVTSWLKGGIVGNIKSVIGTIQEITDEFEDIQGRSLISNSLTTNIETIQTGISAITGIKFDESIVSSFLKNGISGNIKSMIQTLLDIANDFEDIQGRSLIEDSLISEIGIIQTGIDSITGIKFHESLLSSFLKNGISDNIKSMIATIINITDSFEDLEGRSLIEDSLIGEIGTIQKGIDAITGIKFHESVLSSFLKKGVSGNIKNLINTLIDIADSFEDLQGRSLILSNLTNDEGTGEIDIIQSGIDKITGIKFHESVISSWLKNGIVDNIKSVISSIINIADDLEDIQGRSLILNSLTNDEGTGEIDIIQTAINKIAEIKFDGGIGVDGMKTAHDMFNELLEIGNVLENVQALNLIEDTLMNDGGGELDIIESAVRSLSKFATDDIVNNLTGMSNALNSIVNDLTKTFPPEFKDLGKLLAQKINDGFKSKLDLQTILSAKIKALSTAGANGIGSSIAKALSAGFESSLNLGDKIHNSIVKALASEYSAKINVDLMTNKVDNSNSNSSSTKYPTVVMASGGRVATDSQLQDSPEKPLLGNGEYVIPAKIVKALGTPFFDKLRSGQISRTFAGLAQSVSNTTSSVVNNIYNNQTTNQHMTVYPSGHQDMMMISNRRVRV